MRTEAQTGETMTDEQAAALLLDARQGGPLASISIADTAQAYRVQRIVMRQLGPIGGWKVGAACPDSPPSCAPMPSGGMISAPAELPAADYPQREIESEICFIFARSLPLRSRPYGDEEVLSAIGSCHPGIEVLQSRLADPETAPPLALLADFIQHGAYVTGGAVPNWREVAFDRLAVIQRMQGQADKHATGNPAGSMVRLMTWLANAGAVWAGGIEAGQVVTCGSWTGKTHLAAGAAAYCEFAGAPRVHIHFPA